METDDSLTVLTKGAIGLLAALGGLLVSNITVVRDWLQVLSLALGCVVAALTIWQLCKKRTK